MDRLRNDYFVKPVSATQAPNYYQKDDPLKTSWNTEAMCFETMLEKDRSENNYKARAKEIYGSHRADMCFTLVEKDLNLIVYNAIIYNNQSHPVNVAARRLSDVIQKAVGELEENYRFCSICGGDELYMENPISICDWYDALAPREGIVVGSHALQTCRESTRSRVDADGSNLCAHLCQFSHPVGAL